MPSSRLTLTPRLRYSSGRGPTKNNLFKYAGLIFLSLSVLIGAGSIVSFQQHQKNEAGQVLGAVDQNFLDYSVQPGETIFTIAQTQNLSWTTIVELNQLKSPFTLKPGQIIKVPKQ